jgi:hypothetical protein
VRHDLRISALFCSRVQTTGNVRGTDNNNMLQLTASFYDELQADTERPMTAHNVSGHMLQLVLAHIPFRERCAQTLAWMLLHVLDCCIGMDSGPLMLSVNLWRTAE